MQNKQKLLIGLVVALVVLLGAAYYFKLIGQPAKVAKVTSPVAKVEKTNVNFAKLPDRFPAAVPMEANAKITQNYNATADNGTFQATRTFQTTQTLDANLKLYTDFLAKDGWKIGATTNTSTYKMVMGTKDNKTLIVNIDENKVTKTKTVSISYTETPVRK